MTVVSPRSNFLSLAFGLLVALAPQPLLGATIQVDESSPGVGTVEVASDGLCSLREAIANANSDSQNDTAAGECEAGSGADTIVLPASAAFTLPDAAVLDDATYGNSGLPHITSTVTIQGNGATIERDGSLLCNLAVSSASAFRIFTIINGGDDELTIEDVSLQYGCASGDSGSRGSGGAILNQGTLTVRRSTLGRNFAFQLGGALRSDGTALVDSSTLSDNFSYSGGGGIVAAGSVTVRSSTLSNNSASTSGGGVVVGPFGTLTLENVTFSENTATETDSSGGIYNLSAGSVGGTVNAKNTIFDASSCSEVSSAANWNASGASFDSETTCSSLFGSSFTANAVLDLGPLADNGGPTETHALGSSSEAIDAVAAVDCSLATDQRGESRPLDGDGDATALCDAGAFELVGLAIGDVTQAEGNTGSSTFSFTLSRGTATLGDATVQVGTADGSATAGSDYTAIAAQTATIPDGASSTTIDVPVAGDTVYELAETFRVDLTNATNGVLTDASGLGRITNDDAAPVFSISDVTLAEGDGGTTAFTFTIAKTGATEVTATVDAASSDGTATLADNDYTALPLTTVTFTPAEAGKSVTVNVNGDLVAENDETFEVDLSNPMWATIGDNVGLGTITNDDIAGVSASKTTVTVSEDGTVSDSFTIVLASEPLADVTIGLSSSNTAEGTVAPPSLTFTSANWNVAQTVTVTGVDDVIADGDVAFTIVTADAASADPTYGGMVVADVSATNLDDETSATDSDGDGVDSVVEDGGPNGGDANGDGTPDSVQPTVATFPAANGNGFITLMSSCQLREVEAVLEDGLEPIPRMFPYALVEFRLPCTSADMTVLYHAGSDWDPETGYWKYGPETPGQALTTKWYRLPGVVFDTTMVAGTTVARASFTLDDGELGDDTGVDGEIVDQGGPSPPLPVAIPTASEWMLLLLAAALATAGLWRMR